eukprot:1117896-Rhodomonas_salina.4
MKSATTERDDVSTGSSTVLALRLQVTGTVYTGRRRYELLSTCAGRGASSTTTQRSATRGMAGTAMQTDALAFLM